MSRSSIAHLGTIFGMTVGTPATPGHPSAETLLAYHHGELDTAAADPLRSHLEHCPSCRRIILDLAGLSTEEDPELADAWQRLETRRRPSDPPASIEDRKPAPGVGRRSAVARVWLPLAAALVLLATGALLGTAFFGGPGVRRLENEISTLERELEGLRAPRLSVRSATLLPEGYLRDEPPTLELAPGNEMVVLELAGADPLPEESHRLELRDGDGALLWQGDGLLADGRGHFMLVLPTPLLPSGRVEIRLVGPGKVLLYPLHIHTADRADTIPPP